MQWLVLLKSRALDKTFGNCSGLEESDRIMKGLL